MDSSIKDLLLAIRGNDVHDDNERVLTILTSVCFCIVMVEFGFRAYSVYIWYHRKRTIYKDDIVFLAAVVGLTRTTFK
jgi:hypothetical protein